MQEAHAADNVYNCKKHDAGLRQMELCNKQTESTIGFAAYLFIARFQALPQ
jgi:hypothetical protein